MANFYSIMVVDIENFSSRSNPVQKSLRSAMYEVMVGAVEDAHLPWDRFVTEDRGDGMLLIIPPELSPISLAGDLMLALGRVLAEKAGIYSADHALRMRVALHHGLASPDARGWSGDAVNFTFQLCDADPLRDALAGSAEANLALIVSDEFYRAVIQHQHRSIDVNSFVSFSFEIKHHVGVRAWVQVPGQQVLPRADETPTPPPGPTGAGGIPPVASTPGAAAPSHGGGSTIAVHGNANGPIVGRDYFANGGPNG